MLYFQTEPVTISDLSGARRSDHLKRVSFYVILTTFNVIYFRDIGRNVQSRHLTLQSHVRVMRKPGVTGLIPGFLINNNKTINLPVEPSGAPETTNPLKQTPIVLVSPRKKVMRLQMSATGERHLYKMDAGTLWSFPSSCLTLCQSLPYTIFQNRNCFFKIFIFGNTSRKLNPPIILHFKNRKKLRKSFENRCTNKKIMTKHICNRPFECTMR